MKKLLYIIDDINYKSGARMVTLFQMQELKKIYDVHLLTLARPKEELDFLDKDHVLYSDIWKVTEIYAISFKKAMREKKYTIKQKISRILYAISLRCGYGDIFFEKILHKQLMPLMESFDDVIVVSEASKLRGMVSKLQNPKKIQWIHTDYARWSEYSEWSKAVTQNDAVLYKNYDYIVVLSEYCKKGLIRKLPEIAEKVVVIPNMIDGDKIKRLAAEKCPIEVKKDILNLITVARIDHEKRIDKILELAKQMKLNGELFNWFIVGDGPLKEELEHKCSVEELDEYVKFLGHMENPYTIMSQCDALVLLSKYEGTPVTIDEAMVLGIGVVAPEIGGIPEQTKGYKFCIFFKSLNFYLNNKMFDVIRVKKGLDYNTENAKRVVLLNALLIEA